MTTPVTGPQYADDPRQVARWIDEEGKVQFDYLDITDVSFKGRFGMAARSDTEHDVSIGNKTFYLDRPVDMRVGDDVQIVCLNNYDLFMWGEIADIENAGEADMSIEVYIDDICPFDDVNQTNWEIQVVARPKPGIEKDVSFSSVDLWKDGPFLFEVTAGKFFPIGGQLLIKPTTDRTIALLGRVLGYEGTTLTVGKTVANTTAEITYDSWSIALLDAPITYSQGFVEGLQIAQHDLPYCFYVQPGAVMDSTGEVLLRLESEVVKSLDEAWAAETGPTETGAVVLVNLAGTITNSGTTITGVGTSFTTTFDPPYPFTIMSGYNTGNQYTFSTPTSHCVLSKQSGGTNSAARITSISSSTTLSVNSLDLFTASASAFRRNALLTQTAETTDQLYFIYIIRNPSTGAIDISVNTGTPNGLPDLPSGYTQWRLIGAVVVQHRAGSMDKFDLIQPVHAQFLNLRPSYFGRLPRNSVIGNPSASSAAGTAIIAGSPYSLFMREDTDLSFKTILELSTKATPAAGDYVLITDGAASNVFKKADISTISGGGGGGGIPTDWGLITEAVDDTEDFGTIV